MHAWLCTVYVCVSVCACCVFTVLAAMYLYVDLCDFDLIILWCT